MRAWTYDEEPMVMRRVMPQAGSIGRALLELGGPPGSMIICPRCASRRVVLLTFPEEDSLRTRDTPPQMARCADCGHRLTPQEITRQEKPSLN